MDPCSCLNNSTNENNGQFSELIQLESISGETWTVMNNTGLYSPSSPTPPLAPVVIFNGSALESGLTDGTDNDNDGQIDELDENVFYTLEGIHVDGEGYILTATNGTDIQFIFNKCYYPKIQPGIGNIVIFENLPIDLTAIANYINGVSSMSASGSGSFDLYDGAGNLIQANITALPSSLILGNEYILLSSFNEDAIIPLLPPGPGTPGCTQQLPVLFKVLSSGCSN